MRDRLRPSDIRFSQDTIKTEFQYGGSLENTIEDILSRHVQVDDFPPISVVQMGNIFYSVDNRRLYVFRSLEYEGFIKTIKVKKISMTEDRSKFTTTNEGVSIRVRGKNTHQRSHSIDEIRKRQSQRKHYSPAKDVQQNHFQNKHGHPYNLSRMKARDNDVEASSNYETKPKRKVPDASKYTPDYQHTPSHEIHENLFNPPKYFERADNFSNPSVAPQHQRQPKPTSFPNLNNADNDRMDSSTDGDGGYSSSFLLLGAAGAALLLYAFSKGGTTLPSAKVDRVCDTLSRISVVENVAKVDRVWDILTGLSHFSYCVE